MQSASETPPHLPVGSATPTTAAVAPAATVVENVVILGSGPAAYAAAVYAGRGLLAPLLFEGPVSGGQLMMTTDIENYPGLDEPLSGFDLMSKMRRQAAKFGARIVPKTVTAVDLTQRPFVVSVAATTATTERVRTHAIIVATGATAKRLHVEGEDRFWMQGGISACATCDGALPMFRNRPVAVVGGGDTACEEALFLTRFASRVYVVHRRRNLRASRIMQQRVRAHPKIELVLDAVVTRALPSDADPARLGAIELSDTTATASTGARTWQLPVAGLFYGIGHTPNTALFEASLALDEDKYIRTRPGSTHTNIEGVLACGDVQDKVYRQAITAAGSGCMAAMDAERYLAHHGPGGNAPPDADPSRPPSILVFGRNWNVLEVACVDDGGGSSAGRTPLLPFQ